MVLLHGLTVSWRIWRPVLGALEAEHDVFAMTLPGHRGGPVLAPDATVSITALADAVETTLDAAGIGAAHLVGNSLGGWIALELGRRGRARSVVALSPAGGWNSARDLRRVIRLLSVGQATMRRHERLRLQTLLRRPRLRRVALRSIMERGDHLPAHEIAGLIEDSVGCAAFDGFMRWIRGARPIDQWRGTDGPPVRIAWAQHDRVIPFRRYGRLFLQAVPDAEQVTLHGVGHVPMFDDPGLVAQTILDVTRRADSTPPEH
jgi:pimeloyl-ACP methyl ester carboxylesterase